MTRVESELILERVKASSPETYTNPVLVDMLDEDHQKSPEELIDTARHAFNTHTTKSLQFRKTQLKSLLKFLDDCKDDIIRALYEDLRKHRQEVIMGELDLLRNDLVHTLIKLKEWMKPQRPEKRLINLLDTVRIYSDPYGVVLIMGAWNYPFMLLLGPLIGAIAGGNCAILKPSELAPASANLIAQYLPKYLDRKCYHVITGGIEETTNLLQNKFDYIFFTGSTMVGKIIHQAAARFLTPTTLELGGKSPVFLDNDGVDMEKATRRILWGKCLNSGQTCISPDYLLCTRETRDKFLYEARKILREFYGDDEKLSPSLSRILTDRHYNRLVAFIESSNVALGAKFDPRERIISPTILIDVDADSPVMQEEIFGPILPIITVDSPEAAVEFIQNRDKPLALYVFTRSRKTRDLFLNCTSSGGVTINDTAMHILTENLPFGGVGSSGMGCYHGKQGFDTFTHKKAVLERRLNNVSELMTIARYPPYSDFKADFLSFAGRRRRSLNLTWMKNVLVFGLGVGVALGLQSILT